jgi:cell division septation protein DedD
MRQDAKTLLDRLDRQHLDYQDFTAAAEEIELWPLFQALLRDPRIVGNREQPASAAAVSAGPNILRTGAAPSHPEVTAPPPPQPAPPPQHPAAALFGRYGREVAPEPAPQPPREPDLRNFLHQLGKGRA